MTQLNLKAAIALSFIVQVPDIMADTNQVDIFSLSLESLSNLRVTTVSQISEDRDRAPGTVHVISKQMIKERGYRSLKDVLQVIPGFTVFMNELMFTAGVRGLNSNDNEKFSLLINGRESNGVNEPNILNGPINLDSLERVEVIVGPSSLFQQANTLVATVNVITQKVDGVKAVVAHGNDQPYGSTVMAGKQWNEERFVSGSITYEKKDGYDAWDQVNRPLLDGRDITGQLAPSVFAHLEGQFDNWWGQVLVHDSDDGAELQLSGTGLNNDAYLRDKMYQLDLEHSYDWSQDLTSKVRFGIAYKQQQRMNKNGFPPDGGLEQQIEQTDYKTEFGVEYKGFSNHLIQAGLQLSYENNSDSFYTLNSVKTTLIDENTHAVGAYLSDSWQYNDKLKLIAGLRADENTIVDNGIHWGGRLAAIYDVSDRWITKVMMNRAVRMPSPIAALNKEWGINNPSPPTFAQTSPTADKPEVLTTYEWQNIAYFDGTRLSATLYYQELDDFITWVAPHTNAGDYDGYGIELELIHNFNDDLSMWATASYIDSEFEAFFDIDSDPAVIGNEHVQVNSNGEIVGAPEFTANIGINYRVNKQWNINSQVRYLTKQTAFSLEQEEFEKLDNRVYLDAALTYEDFLLEGVDLRLSGQNILNNRKKLATQWSKTQFEPRGATYLLTLYSDF